jgi:hypothetical protein
MAALRGEISFRYLKQFILVNLIITLKMFINFIGNIFYARKRNIIVSLYIVNVIYTLINIIPEDLQQQ